MADGAVPQIERDDLTETIGPLKPARYPVPTLIPGSVVAERYEVRNVLGKGGHAVVYLALDRLLGREVALKVLRSDRMGEVALERFRREAAVARDAASPHLVRIFDLGTAGETTFLTVEYVEGETLRERVAREGHLPLNDALAIARKVLEGLRSLHRAGVAHRDVKPSNILIGGDGQVKLADFGLAFQWNRDDIRLTETLHVVGTAEYLSPEQIRGERVGPASDLYSMGVVLYETLTGRLPHPRGSSPATLLARLEERPADPRSLRPETPPWVARLVECLLEKRAADRPDNAARVLAWIEQQRGPRLGHRRARRLAVAAVLSILLGVSALAGWQQLGSRSVGPHFSHLRTIDGVDGLQAVADDGTVLWTRVEARARDFVPLHVGPARRLLFAAALPTSGDPNGNGEDDRFRLVLLDPNTGDFVRDVSLPLDAEAYFPDFKGGFGPELAIWDLDGDGSDEVVPHFFHRYWPSFTLLYEPEADQTRTLLVAAGHHRLAGLADVDGDGADEALFVGVSNKLGYYYALAAVRVVPRVDAPPVNRYTTGPWAFTPDPYLAGRWNTGLVWYALLPTSVCAEPECVRVDTETRTIRVTRPNREDLVLDFDGFLAGRSTPLPPTERQRARRDSYEHLSEAERLILGGYQEEAVATVTAALEEARRADDPWLQEWAGRSAAQVLIRAGRRQEGEERARALMLESEMEPEIAYETGRTLQLSGWPERAIPWFREGLGVDPTPVRGRNRYEVTEGLVLAYAELDDWNGAHRALRELANAQSPRAETLTAPYLGFVLWRSGGRPKRLHVTGGSPDPNRYWALEIRLLLGDPLPDLLEEVRTERRSSWETVPLLTSLEGEILARMGHPDEALVAARRAFERAGLEVKTSTVVRGHLGLVTERLTRLLREQGLDDEATRVEEETARTLRRRG